MLAKEGTLPTDVFRDPRGGFARVHEVKDMTTNVTYAGKIIPKSRITKQHHKEKDFDAVPWLETLDKSSEQTFANL
ncbi:unnamed protein product [Cyprideis torosa]|uniref:Uncharacterized protein n=1 Tax=Cyprideis torosa TaxID=163714 RepID=A0A7R8W008_9CRUS|nr:unnamed protein product [Cyprideis torosa]CAG0879240.1 unnamed protein product [Cyprideis torosa]